MNQKIKQIIIVVVVIVIAYFGFKSFFGSSTPTDPTLIAENASSSQFVDGQTILDLLDKLNGVVLDGSIFSDKVFVSLVSFEKPIQDQVVGRPNPFLPIGVDGSGIIISRNSTTTLNTVKSTTTRLSN